MAELDPAAGDFLKTQEPARALTSEMAWGGAVISAGIVADEHNADLKGTLGLKAATKMRRTSAQVRATVQAIGLPVRSTVWTVEPAKNAGSAEKEAAEILQANLMGGMETSWDDLLREATLAVYYGYRVPEIVWEERAGLLAVRKIASRNPEMLERWLTDDAGRLVGYVYAGTRPAGGGLSDLNGTGSKYERIAIPLEKSLHFCYDRENDSPAGFGLWRSMYPHWFNIDVTYKIMAIGLERSLLGVPYGELADTDQDDEKTALLTILKRLRAAHDGAFVLQKGQKVSWFESSRNLMDAMPFIYHHASQISLAGLCQFLNLGMQEVGTQAVGAVHAKLFETAEDAIARWIEQAVNTQLVDRWARYNYGEGLKPPRVTHRPIRSRDLGQWATALNTLVTGGLFHATVEDELWLRGQFELPEIERKQLESLEQERKAQEVEKHQAELARMTQPAAVPVRATEDDCGAHRFAEDATDEQKARQAQEDAFSDRASELLAEIEQGYLNALAPLVRDAQDAAKIAKGKPIDRLPDVAVPGARKYQEFVRGYLLEVFDRGRQALAEETGQKADRPITNELRQWIRAKSETLADSHLSQLRAAVLDRVLTGLRARVPAEEILTAAESAGIEALQENTVRAWSEAATELLAAMSEEVQ